MIPDNVRLSFKGKQVGRNRGVGEKPRGEEVSRRKLWSTEQWLVRGHVIERLKNVHWLYLCEGYSESLQETYWWNDGGRIQFGVG